MVIPNLQNGLNAIEDSNHFCFTKHIFTQSETQSNPHAHSFKRTDEIPFEYERLIGWIVPYRASFASENAAPISVLCSSDLARKNLNNARIIAECVAFRCASAAVAAAIGVILV